MSVSLSQNQPTVKAVTAPCCRLTTAGRLVKQRLQKVLFHQNVKFSNGIYGSAETCLFFKLLNESEVEKTNLATLPGIEPG
jgi:hypothetical protein